MNTISLRVPFSSQGKQSGNCGPCSIKMLADYYHVTKPTGEYYSIPSLNRLCRVSRQWGCEVSDMNRVLGKLGLKRHKVSYRNIKSQLKKSRPILTLLIDELGEGHYALIKGIDKNGNYIFHDSFWGKNFRRQKMQLKQQTRYFNHWLWAISKKN